MHERPSSLDRGRSAATSQRECGTFTGRFCDEVHRTADTIAVHVSLEGFVHFHGFQQVCWHGIELDLTDARFGRRHIHAIDGGVRQPRFEAAYLNVLPLPFVALEGDARQAADCVRDVGVRERSDYLVWRYLQDVVAVFSRLTASASPKRALPSLRPNPCCEVTSIFTSTVATCPALTFTTLVNNEKPTYVTVMV